MSAEQTNDQFRANMLAEIKRIQEELTELKDIKKSIVKKTVKRKPARKATKSKRKTRRR